MPRSKEEEKPAAEKPNVITVERDLHKRLKILAARRDVFLREMVEEWLWQRLQEEERKKTGH